MPTRPYAPARYCLRTCKPQLAPFSHFTARHSQPAGKCVEMRRGTERQGLHIQSTCLNAQSQYHASAGSAWALNRGASEQRLVGVHALLGAHALKAPMHSQHVRRAARWRTRTARRPGARAPRGTARPPRPAARPCRRRPAARGGACSRRARPTPETSPAPPAPSMQAGFRVRATRLGCPSMFKSHLTPSDKLYHVRCAA